MVPASSHAGHRRRIMDRAIKGDFDQLKEHEIVEVLLFNTLPRVNTNELAHKLVDTFGSLHAICGADVEELTAIDGIGLRTAEFFKMLPTYVKCYEFSFYNDKQELNNIEIIGDYCKRFFAGDDTEGVYALYLNIHRNLIKRIKVSSGTSTMVEVDYKTILKHAIDTSAPFVVLTHNHPNGVLLPSQNDITFTTNIAIALSNIQTELIDHIIVSGDRYFSFEKENIKIYK